jgi:hypothetical protein
MRITMKSLLFLGGLLIIVRGAVADPTNAPTIGYRSLEYYTATLQAKFPTNTTDTMTKFMASNGIAQASEALALSNRVVALENTTNFPVSVAELNAASNALAAAIAAGDAASTNAAATIADARANTATSALNRVAFSGAPLGVVLLQGSSASNQPITGLSKLSYQSCTASGADGPVAMGMSATASGDFGATAIGDRCYATGNNGATAMGTRSTASGDNGATAIGDDNEVDGDNGATALGRGIITRPGPGSAGNPARTSAAPG